VTHSPLQAAVDAARRVEPDWSAERAERNLARVHARRELRTKVTRAAFAASLVGLLLLGLTAWSKLHGRGEVARASHPGPAAPSGQPVVAGPRTTFADGSVARVSEGGELSVTLASAERIESKLVAGAAEFEVSKRPERDFIVAAGSVRVRVVGTRFRVELVGARTRVAVSEGKVEVQDGDDKTYLEAGESRFFPQVVAGLASGSAGRPPAPVVSGRARFLELARGGNYKEAYQVMRQSPGVVGSTAEELMLAADAARLSNHPEQALTFLRRVTAEHRADSRAPLAAFTAGRVLSNQLGRPAEAAEAYALSRRLRPGGSLAEDALAREAEARAAGGEPGRARTLAQQYLSRYPSGKHRQTLQRLAPGP
jgi:transmembrane sensor